MESNEYLGGQSEEQERAADETEPNPEAGTPAEEEPTPSEEDPLADPAAEQGRTPQAGL